MPWKKPSLSEPTSETEQASHADTTQPAWNAYFVREFTNEIPTRIPAIEAGQVNASIAGANGE